MLVITNHILYMDSMNIPGPDHSRQKQNRAPDLRVPAKLLEPGALLPANDQLVEPRTKLDTAARLLEVRQKLADPANLRVIDAKLAEPAELLPALELDEPVQLRNVSGSSMNKTGIGSRLLNWLKSPYWQ